MIRTAVAITALFTLTTPAFADKFHFGTADEAKKTEGNAEKDRAVEGVLLSQDDKTYTIRVVGGEMTIPKAQVVRVEKDDMTVAAIEKMEKDQAEGLAAADTRRREIMAAEASARVERRSVAREDEPGQAERSIVIEVDFQGLLPGYTFRTYDPVLHRANLTGLRQVIEDYLRTEVRAAAHRSDRR